MAMKKSYALAFLGLDNTSSMSLERSGTETKEHVIICKKYVFIVGILVASLTEIMSTKIMIELDEIRIFEMMQCKAQ